MVVEIMAAAVVVGFFHPIPGNRPRDPRINPSSQPPRNPVTSEALAARPRHQRRSDRATSSPVEHWPPNLATSDALVAQPRH